MLNSLAVHIFMYKMKMLIHIFQNYMCLGLGILFSIGHSINTGTMKTMPFTADEYFEEEP